MGKIKFYILEFYRIIYLILGFELFMAIDYFDILYFTD